MAATTRELRQRIRGIRSIKQITKAMEMIAASKMRRAQRAALTARPYANLASEILSSLALVREGKEREEERREGEAMTHALLRSGEAGAPKLFIVITPNRGLCGALPTQVVSAAMRDDPEAAAKYIAVGRKAQRALLRGRRELLAAFDGFETQPSIVETQPIAHLAIDAFTRGIVSSVTMVYAEFVSTLRYEVRMLPLLPISAEGKGQGTADAGESIEFLFEPSPHEILSQLLPRLVSVAVYQAILEGLAAEHSARMVMMQNASKAADDLLADFLLTYHSARQAAITAELADITGGRLVLASQDLVYGT